MAPRWVSADGARGALTERRRSLVTTLHFARKFEDFLLSSQAVAPLIDVAKVFCVEGHFLTHGTDSIPELSKKASEKGKVGRTS